MPTLYASCQEEMQSIVDKEYEFVNKEHTDEEIIKLIEKQVTDFTENYNGERIYWWDTEPGSFFSKEKTVLNSLHDTDKTIIKKHITNNFSTLNLDLYFNFFNSISFKNCKGIISDIIIKEEVVSRLTDDQVIDLYKHFSNECRKDSCFRYVKERIRNLFLEEKYKDVLNKEQEVLTFLNLRWSIDYYTFLKTNDVYFDLKLNSEELKNIINKYDFDYINDTDIQNFWNMLSYRKGIITSEIKNILFKKIIESDHLLSLLWRKKAYNMDYHWFYSYNILTKTQLDKLCKEMYDIVADDKLYEVNSRHACNNFKRKFLVSFDANWKSPTKDSQKEVIINRMVIDLINHCGCVEDIQLNMMNLYNFTKGKNWKIGEANSKKLLNAMKKNYVFLETVLDTTYLDCPYDFKFIKNSIICDIDSSELLDIINNKVNFSQSIEIKNIKTIFTETMNIIENENDEKKIEENSSKIINSLFNEEINYLNSNEYTNIYRYLTKDSFKFLTKENKDKLISNSLITDETCVKITSLINCGYIKGDDLVGMWNHDINNLDFHLGIIDAAFTEYDGSEIKEELMFLIAPYLEEHKQDYIRYILKNRRRKWTDLEVGYICLTENINTISAYLNESYRFSDEQWDKIFRHFYHMKENPFVPYNRYLFEHYLEFDSNYNRLISDIKYKDGDLINQVDNQKINKVVKRLKKKAKKAELSDEVLPF